MIMQTLKKKKIIFFLFFVLPFFQKKHKIKYNKVGIETTFLLMMKIRKAKSPKQVHFRLGWDERIFFEKQKTTNRHIIRTKE